MRNGIFLQNKVLECFFLGSLAVSIKLNDLVTQFFNSIVYFSLVAHQQNIHFGGVQRSFCYGIHFRFCQIGQYLILLLYIIGGQVIIKDTTDKSRFLESCFTCRCSLLQAGVSAKP